jgi:two-component system sensor histidine kinase PilS (NtrC family)
MIIVRLITVTSLLVSAIIIQISVVPASSVAPVYYLVLVAYALSGVYLLFYTLNRSYTVQAYVQTFLDLLFITAFVYTSGGVTSATYALYIFAVIGAGLVISRRAAFLTAALAAILFGLLVDGLFFGIIRYFRPEHVIDMGLGPLLFIILTAWSSFFVIAFLVSYLAENLRRTRQALRRAQKELIIKERLAEAGRVSASLAHEIRNPLAAIAGSVQFLRSELKLGHEQRELMEIVLKESRRVSQAIEQFLDFASPGPRVFTEVNLSETLDETLKILQRRFRPQVRGHVELQGGRPPLLRQRQPVQADLLEPRQQRRQGHAQRRDVHRQFHDGPPRGPAPLRRHRKRPERGGPGPPLRAVLFRIRERPRLGLSHGPPDRGRL